MNLFKERLDKINLYQKVRKRFFQVEQTEEKQTCPACGSEHISDQLICLDCHYHIPMKATQRIHWLVDDKSFREVDKSMKTKNPRFDGYKEKLEQAQTKSQLNEAYIYGYAKIDQYKVIVGVMDSHFMMGSMGSVVGEKITRSIELAHKHKVPWIIFCASGGARMQEGILSLVQMAKTTNALAQLNSLSLSILTHPTTGGVSASFALTTDIVLAEPRATIGFAGKRVIQQTIKQELPEDFQSSEFNAQHGFIDQVISRDELKEKIVTLLTIHQGEKA